MNKFSIVIITLNEEHNIARCLDSVKGLSDDIVVVDSGSKDKTELICANYNVRFIYNEFKGYSSQKNFGNLLAKNDFIFSIDADEVVSEELKCSILNLNLEEKTAYFFNRLNFYSGKPIRHSGWYPDRKIRIWNKRYGEWEGLVHEKIVFNDSIKMVHIKGDLLHYTYNNVEEHLRQTIKYSLLNARNDFEKGKTTNILKIMFFPVFRFISVYFLKLGFLDGYSGYFISKAIAFGNLTRNMELKNMLKKEKKRKKRV